MLGFPPRGSRPRNPRDVVWADLIHQWISTARWVSRIGLDGLLDGLQQRPGVLEVSVQNRHLPESLPQPVAHQGRHRRLQRPAGEPDRPGEVAAAAGPRARVRAVEHRRSDDEPPAGRDPLRRARSGMKPSVPERQVRPVLLDGADGKDRGTSAAMASPTSGEVIVSSSITSSCASGIVPHNPYHAVAPPSTTSVVPVM